jgi:glycosyltransferase involved in cell wall biosynthesis
MFIRKIGLFYINDINWIGGMDYVVNAVNSLGYLSKEKQPNIEIIVSDEVNIYELADRIRYAKYKFYIIPKGKRNIIYHFLFNRLKWKFIYPFPKGKIFDRIFFGLNEKRKVFWIPDFQEEYYSHLFSEDIIEKRRLMRSSLARQSDSLVVLSSQNAREDFLKFYGPELKAKTKVLRFANPDKWDFQESFIKQTLYKYKLEKNKFFICPNQMWEHKNHILLLQALREAITINPEIKIVFCGREHDPRKPNFAVELKFTARDLVESKNVYFLGFLPKDEQMCLVKLSTGLIQPSMFEGWSTTIEDGISMKKQVFALDLKVNKEQLGSKGVYFKNKTDLIGILLKMGTIESDFEITQQYLNARIEDFATNLVTLLD